ncbi:3-hydroxyisobutyryl-CoA hydrolase, mitochondrial-like [Diabrotica virgifera virgifera]|uniref:3-hydroxyisobutyryl-CoA hydrolase, mitochondrial n=1 Tax=Diabrotica virgifera virgifera TaxID=50390 RepID=A0ABM5K1N3_DIAVI|nr:3-hydroxyisobutyryl-CoA hydrolase, mitochondrial-like [Diabrotica virgifera virgifera]
MIKQPRSVVKSVKFLLTSISRNVSSQTSEVIVKNVNDKGVLVLNRPKALNALTLSMMETIKPVLKDWESKKSLVLIKGTGEKSFCAGGDIRSVFEARLRGEKNLGHMFKAVYSTSALIGSYKIPYVALIDGIVMGGGVGLSVHGRYRVATERSIFAMPETQIGFFPDVGGSHFLPRLSGKLGWYLGLTGKRLKGSDILKAGIATHICDSKDLPQLEEALLNKCRTDKDIQNTLNKFSKKEIPPFSLEKVIDKIDDYFSASSMENIVAKLENDDTKWAQETLALLRKMSPTSLKVSLKMLELGQHYNLDDCLHMEYNMCLTFLKNNDFFEGVRALLIDKDQKPNWKPNTLEDITTKIVDEYFYDLPKLKMCCLFGFI